MFNLPALHMHKISAYARKRVLFREVSFSNFFVIPAGYYHTFKSKFSCPHTAMPSDTQVHLVLNVEVT